MKHILIFLLRCYRFTISPLLGSVCRFSPTCSQYALDAVHEHGAFKGLYLACVRLCKCHPWHPGGHDPVPLKKGKETKET